MSHAMSARDGPHLARAEPRRSAGVADRDSTSSRYSRIAGDWMRIASPISRDRHPALRVDRPVLRRAAARPSARLIGHRLVGDALKIKRDPHPIGGGGAEIAIKLHAVTPPFQARWLRAWPVELVDQREKVLLLRRRSAPRRSLLLESKRLRRKPLVDGAALAGVRARISSLRSSLFGLRRHEVHALRGARPARDTVDLCMTP